MNPRKPSEGRCGHVGPVVAEQTPDGRVARCLGCGLVGPTSPTSGGALAALRGEPRPSFVKAG